VLDAQREPPAADGQRRRVQCRLLANVTLAPRLVRGADRTSIVERALQLLDEPTSAPPRAAAVTRHQPIGYFT
jgi:hypothetical protein